MTEEELEEFNDFIDAGLTVRFLRDRVFPLDFADVWNFGAWNYIYANARQRFGMLPLWFEATGHLTREEYLWLLRGGDQ